MRPLYSISITLICFYAVFAYLAGAQQRTAHAAPLVDPSVQVRLDNLESRVKELSDYKLSERLGRVEATVEMDNKLLLSLIAAIAIMLIERIFPRTKHAMKAAQHARDTKETE